MPAHCQYERDVVGLVPPWDLWFPAQTPVVPEMYWNVVSNEQRYKTLCCTMASLIEYSKILASSLNEVTDEVKEQLEAQNKWVLEQMAKLEAELKKLIEETVGTSFDWDVTQGAAAPTLEAHRRLYWWLTPSGLTVSDWNAGSSDMTVADLAESGLNCQGWAQYGGDYLNLGIAGVPGYYRYKEA